MTKQKLYLGIMSGTSLDGVDIAVVDFSSPLRQTTSGKTVKAATTYPMPEQLRQDLLALYQGQVHLQKLGELNQALGELYADSVLHFLKENQLTPQQIAAIGCHGQTIWHSPTGDNPFTMQIGNPQIIATRTQIITVADFRNKDIVLGGQGAPLVPAFHQAMFFDENYDTAVLNIGGISNVSLLSKLAVQGFDTGPGNALLDLWIEKSLGLPFDENGKWAKTGKILPNFVAYALKDAYFQLPPPKSTGREYFNLAWLEKIRSETQVENALPQDIQASLVEVTAQCSVNILQNWQQNSKRPKRLLLCGGGAKNQALIDAFQRTLRHWQITTTEQFGIHSNDVESAAFAWLAYCRLHHLPSNFPSVTGAKQTTSLGVIYEP